MPEYKYPDYRKDIITLSELKSGKDVSFVGGEPNFDRMLRKDMPDEDYQTILQNRIFTYEYKNPIAKFSRIHLGRGFISPQVKFQAQLKLGGHKNVITIGCIIWVAVGILVKFLGGSIQSSSVIGFLVALPISVWLEH